jgi:hypothetical protein
MLKNRINESDNNVSDFVSFTNYFCGGEEKRKEISSSHFKIRFYFLIWKFSARRVLSDALYFLMLLNKFLQTLFY